MLQTICGIVWHQHQRGLDLLGDVGKPLRLKIHGGVLSCSLVKRIPLQQLLLGFVEFNVSV